MLKPLSGHAPALPTKRYAYTCVLIYSREHTYPQAIKNPVSSTLIVLKNCPLAYYTILLKAAHVVLILRSFSLFCSALFLLNLITISTTTTTNINTRTTSNTPTMAASPLDSSTLSDICVFKYSTFPFAQQNVSTFIYSPPCIIWVVTPLTSVPHSFRREF